MSEENKDEAPKEDTQDEQKSDEQPDAPAETPDKPEKPEKPKAKRVTNNEVLEHVEGIGQRLEKVVNVLSSFDNRLKDVEKKAEQDISPDIRLANQKKAEESRDAKTGGIDGKTLKSGEDMVDIATPPGLRDILNEILGDEFGLIVQQGKFNAALHATVLVPREYSDLSDDVWSMKKCDPRTVPINQATAEEDFRKHCFNIKAHIERTSLKNSPLKSLYGEDGPKS